jgi:phosphoribosylformimino-5-aminoimidazole carboxamide ribotide isomerase
MKIIPVIDLKAGQVVHAVRGMRNHYQAIHCFSQITNSSEPMQVIKDLLKIHPFDSVYIADLDAICGQGDHQRLIEQVQEQFPSIEFWLDSGAQLSQVDNSRVMQRKIVIGTESQRSPPCRTEYEYILSLDFNSQALGMSAWFSDHQFWPTTVILMTLTRVGSNSGPDWQKLHEFIDEHPDTNLIAAGGISSFEDLQQLAGMGLSGVLLATALHSGVITGAQLTELQAKKYPGMPGYFQQPIS